MSNFVRKGALVEDQTRSLSEVAGLMGVSERTIRRWIKSGRLKAYKPGRDYRIPESALREFIEESEVSPKALAAPSSEPTFNDVLEEERRRTELAEIKESYRPSREGLERYCARWERISGDDLDQRAVEEFLQSADEWIPVLADALSSEYLELARTLDAWGTDELRAASTLQPAVDRYFELYAKLIKLWETRFAEARPVAAPVIDFQQKLQERLGAKRAS